MSRLVNFGLGEVCDRITILSLKVLHGGAKGVDTQHFLQERTALMVKLVTRDNGRWVEWLCDLAAVNAALWEREDTLRLYKQSNEYATHRDAIVDCAFQIQDLNDKRALLIQQINAHVGEKAVEKV